MSRKERRKRKQKRLLNFIIFLGAISAIIYISIELYREQYLNNNSYEIKKLFINEYSSDYNEENNLLEDTNKEITYPKETIQETYKGYDVIAKLEIPKIDLETYVINFSESALNISVTKFWGDEPNKVGNFCIAGHNFKNKNMFHNLKKLQIGDTIILKDNNTGNVEYEVYNIYTVIPEDVSCISQDTNGKKEVTLITCTNDSKKRIIVKAREILN